LTDDTLLNLAIRGHRSTEAERCSSAPVFANDA